MVISGNNAVRLFTVSPAVNLTLLNLTLTEGACTGTNGTVGDPFTFPVVQGTPGESAYGGCIYNDSGLVTISNCIVANNRVQGGRGARSAGSVKATAGGAGRGGAIYNSAGIFIANACNFRVNFASGAPGGSDGIGSAPVGDSFGGAICSSNGVLTLSNTFFISNVSTGCVSWSSVSGSPPAGKGFGGAIHCTGGDLLVSGCSFLINTASGGSSIPGSPGRASGLGGAISCTTNALLNCFTSVFEGNTAIGGFGFRHGLATDGQGGALWVEGTAYLRNCTLRRNLATTQANGDQGGRGQGGAIYASMGTVMLSECLFQDNLAQGGQGYVVGSISGLAKGGDGLGGAIYNAATLLLTNSTFFGNKALGGTASTGGSPVGGSAAGGAFFNAAGSVSIMNATFSKNSAQGAKGSPSGASEGGSVHSTNGTVTLFNTILTHSPSGNCFGTLIDANYNLSSDATCNFTNTGSLNNTDPLLGPLQDNGGPTLTLGLTDCSPALDAGSPTIYPTIDQRGVSRPIGSRSDMGACEGVFTWYHTVFSFTNGAVQVTPVGKPNQPFTLSTSTDLLNWTPVLTNILGSDCRFTYSTTNQPHSFYKIVYQ